MTPSSLRSNNAIPQTLSPMPTARAAATKGVGDRRYRAETRNHAASRPAQPVFASESTPLHYAVVLQGYLPAQRVPSLHVRRIPDPSSIPWTFPHPARTRHDRSIMLI